MRARSVITELGYRFHLGHFIGQKWGLGVTASKLRPAPSVHGGPVDEARRLPCPERVAPGQLLACWYGSLFFTFSHASRLLSPSVAVVESSRGAGAPSSLRKSSVADSVSRRAFRAGRQIYSGASEVVQDVKSTNISNEAELVGTSVKKAAAASLKQQLIDTKGTLQEDAEFTSRNCADFMAKLGAVVATNVLVKKDSESVQSCVLSFVEKKDREASNPSFGEKDGGSPYLGEIVQLSKTPLTFNGNESFLKSMAILDSLGWSRHRLWEMLERNPELLTWTAEELQANVFILDIVGVKRKDMMPFMEDSTVFKANLGEKLAPFLQYLEGIGIKWQVFGDLLKFNPQGLIKMPLVNFRERVDFLLELGLSNSDVEKSMRVFPQLIHLRLENLTQKIEYFDGLGVDKDSMVKIVAKLPSIFRHSIEKNLVPKVQMLENLGLVDSSLVKFIGQYPHFFGCSVENLKQKLAFFQTNGLTGIKLVKMITWHPRAFSFSVDDNLSKKLQFLVNKGFVVRSTAMVRALSSCITISTDSLEARFQNLQALDFTHTEVCELVKKQPTILCLSEKTIRCKVDYLMNTMNRSTTEILKCPGYLLYSLELRVKPRHRVVALLTSKGLLRDGVYSLSTILQPSEKLFVQRFVNLDLECFDVYLDGAREKYGKEACSKVDQLASLSLAPKTDGWGEPALASSVQDLRFAQSAAVAMT